MRAVDTNVLVRLIARDDPAQAAAAEAFVAQGAWVSQIALVEALWVLGSVYEMTSRQIAEAVGMLLNHRDLTLQDSDAVGAAAEAAQHGPFDVPVGRCPKCIAPRPAGAGVCTQSRDEEREHHERLEGPGR